MSARRRWALLLSVSACTLSCGLEPPTTPEGAAVITIERFAYSPGDLVVDPGATIVVRNLDAEPHSVTSEAASGQFTPGAVNGVSFDTGAFGAGQRTFVIPSTAPHGTVVPYYCSVHGAGMAQGRVTIR